MLPNSVWDGVFGLQKASTQRLSCKELHVREEEREILRSSVFYDIIGLIEITQ